MTAAPPDHVDAHVHLQDGDLAPHLEVVLDRARAAGVSTMAVNGSSEADWDRVADLALRPGLVPFFGLHPWYVRDRSDRWLETLEAHLSARPSGIGEIGLDSWVKGRDEAAQEQVFTAQLGLARRLGRPVTIHCVQAWGWLERLLAAGDPPGAGMLFHAFGGPVELIPRLVAMGGWFSFSGNALRGGKDHMRAALAAVPAERLLAETDAPDMLPPTPYCRSCVVGSDGRERNEPANLVEIVRGLAVLRGEPLEPFAARVAQNARTFLRPITG